jgi:hypothetical protein
MSEFDEPLKLSAALSELIARRGYAAFEENRQYREAWAAVAGETLSRQTKVARVSRGQMTIEVDHGPLLSELTSFHSGELLKRLQTEFAPLKIKGLRFRLKGLA